MSFGGFRLTDASQLYYNGFDILWVITNDGVQGYTIFQNELAPISNLDLFTEVQFSKGDHIRCDDFSNVWITTRHSGARVILSGENYADYWPSYIGLTSDNSGLLSDVIYDIDFDKNTGEVYFATDMGISILSSPFSDIQHTSNDEYNIDTTNNIYKEITKLCELIDNGKLYCSEESNSQKNLSMKESIFLGISSYHIG